jgi:hypothetical protein
VRLHCVTCTCTGTVIATLSVAVAVASRSASGPRPVSVPRADLVVAVFQDTRSKQQRNLLVTQTCCRPVAAAEPATSGAGHLRKGTCPLATLPRKQATPRGGALRKGTQTGSVSAACVRILVHVGRAALLVMANLAAAAAGRLSQAAILSAPATAPVPSRTLAEAQQRARYFYRQVRTAGLQTRC